MPDSTSKEIVLLRAVYAAFNARDIDAAVALMTPDVAWPKAFKGGFVRGPQELRAYWTEQWSEINSPRRARRLELVETAGALVRFRRRRDPPSPRLRRGKRAGPPFEPVSKGIFS